MKYSLSSPINQMIAFDFEYLFDRFIEHENERQSSSSQSSGNSGLNLSR